MRTADTIAMLTLIVLCPKVMRASDTSTLQIVEQKTFTQISTTPPLGVLGTITVKAILADGSHALLNCSSAEPNCYKVESFAPEKIPVDSTRCEDSMVGTMSVTNCTMTGLGVFKAKRSGNEITVYGPKLKCKFKVTGSW